MQTPPPLPPRPRRKTTVVLGIVAAICIGAAIWSAVVTFLPGPAAQSADTPHAAQAQPHLDLPLRQLDVDRIAAEYPGRQEYFSNLDRATLAEYERTNAASAKWFAEGRQAVRLFVLFAVWNDYYQEGILQAAKACAGAAWDKGCRDPLIEAICDVYTFANRHSNTNDGAQCHIQNTRHLLASQYPALFKFIATGVLLKDLIYTQNHRKGLRGDLSPSWAEIPEIASEVGGPFSALLREKPPTELLYFRTSDLFDRVQDDECLVPVENQIESAFASEDPTNPARAALRGKFLVTWAWQARGSGWANTVSDEGWRKMADRLEQANEVLTTAYEKNPDDYLSATEMLAVELGQGNGRAAMEKWFECAMKGHPDNYSACLSKVWYLQPRWYGSGEAVLQFGLECVKTGNWRAKLPLILPSGLSDVADGDNGLYRNEELWKLVKPVFEEFLKRYPESIGVRTNYANWAARGGHLDELAAQLAALGPNWDRSCWSQSDYQRVSHLAARH